MLTTQRHGRPILLAVSAVSAVAVFAVTSALAAPPRSDAPTVGRSLAAIVVADFDGDRKLDLAVTSDVLRRDHSVWVLRGNRRGGFLRARRFAPAGTDCCARQPFTPSDLNRDGRPDLILANGLDEGVSVLLNTTRRTMRYRTLAADSQEKVP